MALMDQTGWLKWLRTSPRFEVAKAAEGFSNRLGLILQQKCRQHRWRDPSWGRPVVGSAGVAGCERQAIMFGGRRPTMVGGQRPTMFGGRQLIKFGGRRLVGGRSPNIVGRRPPNKIACHSHPAPPADTTTGLPREGSLHWCWRHFCCKISPSRFENTSNETVDQ